MHQTKRNKKLIIITIAIIAVIVSAFILYNIVQPKMIPSSIILNLGNVPDGSTARVYIEDFAVLTLPLKSKLYFEYAVNAIGSKDFNVRLCIYPIDNYDLEFPVVLRKNRPVHSITLEKGTYEIGEVKVAWGEAATNVTITITLKNWEFA